MGFFRKIGRAFKDIINALNGKGRDDFFGIEPNNDGEIEIEEEYLNKKEQVYVNNLIKSLESVKGYDDELDILINKILDNIEKVNKKQLITFLESMEEEREELHIVLYSSDDENIKLNMSDLYEFCGSLEIMLEINE